MPKEDCLARLPSLFDRFPEKPRPTAAVASVEHHQDGELHLHVALKVSIETRVTEPRSMIEPLTFFDNPLHHTQFEEVFETRLPSFFDFLTGKHGNYKPRDSWKGTLEYITKEDSDPCLWASDDSKMKTLRKMVDRLLGRNQTIKITDRVAQMCMDGQPMDKIARTHPGFVMMNQRRIQYFHTWINAPMNKELPPWPGITYLGSDSSTARIVSWVQRNLFTQREFKQRQLYIHGPHNSGKTSFVNSLKRWVRIYKIPPFENYYDFYDDRHDLLFYDEFKAQKLLQWMNLLLQGDDMTLAVKQAQYPKERNLPVIIASNFTPREAYNNVPQATLDTFLSRVDVVHTSTPIDYKEIEFRPPTEGEQANIDRLCQQPPAVDERLPLDERQLIEEHGSSLCPFCGLPNYPDCRCLIRRPPPAYPPPFVSARSLLLE